MNPLPAAIPNGYLPFRLLPWTLLLAMLQGCSIGATHPAETPAERASEIRAIIATALSVSRDFMAPVCVRRHLEPSLPVPASAQNDLRSASASFAPLGNDHGRLALSLGVENLRPYLPPRALAGPCRGRTQIFFSRIQFDGDQAFAFLTHFNAYDHGAVIFRLRRVSDDWRVTETMGIGGGSHFGGETPQLATFPDTITIDGRAG